jgi:hypothetical protein
MIYCFRDLGSHFEALESVLLLFFLVYASTKYDNVTKYDNMTNMTKYDSCAQKCRPWVTKTVMYIVRITLKLFMIMTLAVLKKNPKDEYRALLSIFHIF